MAAAGAKTAGARPSEAPRSSAPGSTRSRPPSVLCRRSRGAAAAGLAVQGAGCGSDLNGSRANRFKLRPVACLELSDIAAVRFFLTIYRAKRSASNLLSGSSLPVRVKNAIRTRVRNRCKSVAVGSAKLGQRNERSAMVPTAWMLHATVERRIIRNRYRLKSKARAIFDADHGRIDFDKRLKKPIVIAIPASRHF